MTQQIVLSGIGTKHLRDSLRLSLIRGRPRVIGVVAAFVSTEGIRQFIEILKRCGEPKCRLIAGTDNAITHPEALFAARDQGWKIRLGRPVRGIFHPKLVVAGRSFSRSSGTIQTVVLRLCRFLEPYKRRSKLKRRVWTHCGCGGVSDIGIRCICGAVERSLSSD